MTKEQIELAKRRAWVEEHFHCHGWTDEEVMAFNPLPSDNFSEGFEAGIRLVEWKNTEEELPVLFEEALVTFKTDWGLAFAVAHYDGEGWHTPHEDPVFRPLYWTPICEPTINS